LKPELFDHSLHAADADLPSALGKFLSDDFGRRFRVEKAMSDHLSNDLGCSTVMSLRAAPLTLQRLSAPFVESGSQLKVALLAEAKLFQGYLLDSTTP
jgi:hypothetical protein